MRLFKQLLFGSCALLFVTMMLTPGGKASDVMRDQRTKVTFNAPLQVPGKVLPGGTYVFKLYEPLSNRNVVQIWNDDQTKVLVTAPTISIERSENDPRFSKTVFTFEERADGTPHALRAWFYPGDTDGHQFVYSPSASPEVAMATTSNEVSMNNTEASSIAPEKIEEPKEEASAAYVAPEPMEQSQPEQSTTTATPSTSNTEPTELPKTASSTPLFALIGMLSLAAGFGLQLLLKRIS